MSRRQQDPEAEYYQEKPKGVNAREESTRRKFIRWFKTHLGHDHKKVSRQPTSLPTPPPQGRAQQRLHKHSLDYSSTSESNASTASNQYYSHSVGELVPPPAPARNAPDYRVHVLIVGGGIGGLCLAQGLKKHGIPFTVFERDPSPNYRSQGYRVRIDSMGYESLKANMNESTFEVFLRSTGHFLPGVEYIDAVTGGAVPHELEQQHMATRASRRHRHMFSADRAMLRSLMLSDLEEDEVQFGMRFKHYEILPNGRVQVTFENGKIVRGSILVGADGTTSRVRRHYIPRCLALLDTDSNAIYGKTLRTPELDAMFPPDNTTIVLSQYPPMSLVVEPRGVNSPRNSSFDESSGEAPPDMPDYICWVLIGRARHFHLDDSITERALFSMEPHQVARLSYAMTRHWSPQIRALFKFQDPEWCSFLRISTMAPKLRSWQPSPVTLMGDAVHTMVPAGFGCNTALFDAHMMVKCFAELGVGVEAIKKYEHQLRAAGREGISLSLEAGKIMFGLPHVDDMRTVAQ